MRFVFCFLSIFLMVIPLNAEDAYQLLRSNPEGYEVVKPGKQFEFPRDHLSHKTFRMEWWYLTANLRDVEGNDYGIHWTLFRQSMSPETDPGGWQSNQVWMAHTAISRPDHFSYEQRFARGGIGQADVGLDSENNFSAWLDNWQWQGESSEPIPGTLKFTTEGVPITLHMRASTPWVLQGDKGYSQKSELGQASYYYSQPHIEIEASIEIEGETIPLQGVGWLDREWSSQPLAPDQPGWDWVSLHLDDGYALMVYRLRQSGRENWLSGVWVDPKGSAKTLKPGDIEFEPVQTSKILTPRGEKVVPLRWRISVPGLGKSWQVQPLDNDHWLDTAFPYWEGPVEVSGSSSGRGYLELTGY